MRWKVGCGGSFDGPTGQITSPNYPQLYDNNLICNYTITAASDTYIVAHFIDQFQIEYHPVCAYDRLSAYQGNNSASQPLGRFCGTQNSTPIVSKSNLFMQFRTDGSIGGSGFKINYTTQGTSRFVNGQVRTGYLCLIHRMRWKDHYSDDNQLAISSGYVLPQSQLHLED